jgi:hypothetical protein
VAKHHLEIKHFVAENTKIEKQIIKLHEHDLQIVLTSGEKHTPEMWSENKPIRSFKKLITLL